MAFSQQTISKMACLLAPEFVAFIYDRYGDDLTELLMNASNDYLAETFNRDMDADVAANLGCELSGYVKLEAVN